MKSEKVILLSLHQAVRFDGAYVTSLADEIFSKHKTKANMELKPDLQCVLVWTANDRALIPFTNCAIIKLLSDTVKKEQEDIVSQEEEAKKSKKPITGKKPR